ncbi:Protein of unknown function, putative, partial [Plasmodium vivax]
KFLENGSKRVTTFDITTHRVLAKQAYSSEVHRRKLPHNTPDDAYNYKLVNGRGNNITYERLKQDKSNNVDEFLKSYKSRYAKKKGLKKFDCYYEKKIFNSINKIEKMVQHKNLTKKHLKKLLYTKYGIPLIMISLIPLLGLIIPMFYSDGHLDGKEKCVKLYRNTVSTGNPVYAEVESLKGHANCNLLPKECALINFFFFTFLALAIISFIIYTYIKSQKYRRIKAGMLK